MPIGTSAEQTAWLCLDGVPGIGPIRALRLLAKASPQQLCQMDSCQLEHLGLSSAQIDSLKHPDPQRMEQAMRWCDEPGHHLVCYGDELYPTWLRAIPAAPLLLFVRGMYLFSRHRRLRWWVPGIQHRVADPWPPC